MNPFIRSLIFTLFLTTSLVAAQPSSLLAAPTSERTPKISVSELEQAIVAHRNDVPEFKVISQFAKKAGIRVWLFGGTAASFAHYAKWDLLRKKGDTRFQPNRFDYDYTNIYRSNQDLDIVIDGTPEQALALQKLLAEKFPHLQGNKSVWEVRLLRQRMGEKEALLSNPEFSSQHTDSHSVGMVELTESNEPVLRDLREWTRVDSSFVEDVRTSKLHYYFSPLHERTQRFKDGLNPPILSVIRYYIKAFQFGLAMDPADESKLLHIIAEFDPQSMTSYENRWLQKNVPKLFQNAVDIEFAWNTLEKVGLRKRLLAISDPKKEGSAAWWMNKEPLRSTPVGGGNGMTAAELGIGVVAHETNSFDAYESITRSHKGDPNVLISRNGVSGETAAYGSGFYTRKGRSGARGTSITIRFDVDPNAREGTDFIVRANDYIIFLNKRALRVIPESLNFGFRDYVIFLTSGDVAGKERALFEKLRRRIGTRLKTDVTQEDLNWFDERVRETADSDEFDRSELIKEWLRIRDPLNTDMPVSRILETLGGDSLGALAEYISKTNKTRRTLTIDEYLDLLENLSASRSERGRTAMMLQRVFEIPEIDTQLGTAALDRWVRNSKAINPYSFWFESRSPAPTPDEILDLARSIKTRYQRVEFTRSFGWWHSLQPLNFSEASYLELLSQMEFLVDPTPDSLINSKIKVTPSKNDGAVLNSYLEKVGRERVSAHVLAELSRRSDAITLDKSRAIELAKGLVHDKIKDVRYLGPIIFKSLLEATGPAMTATDYLTLLDFDHISNEGQRLIDSNLEKLADRVSINPLEQARLDEIMKTTKPDYSYRYRALLKMWLLGSGEHIATQVETLKMIASKKDNFSYMPLIFEAYGEIPSWAHDKNLFIDLMVEFTDPFSNSFKKIFESGSLLRRPDFILKLIDRIDDPTTLSLLADSVFDHPEWKARSVYLAHFIRKVEKMHEAGKSYYYYFQQLPGMIDRTLANAEYRRSPHLRALMKLNPFYARNMNYRNLAEALRVEDARISLGKNPSLPKQSLEKRLLPPRTCERLFLR